MVEIDFGGGGGLAPSRPSSLLPFVANATQLHPTTRLPQAAKWRSSWGGIGCAWEPHAPARCFTSGMSSLISRSCSSGTPPRTRTLAATGHAHAAAESTLSRARAQIALAFHFYSQLFGWQKTDAMDMGPIGVR